MIKRIFITGLAAIIPIVITIYVIIALFYFADSILGNFLNKILHKTIGFSVPGLGIILFILIIFVTGILIHISRRRFFRWVENMFLRIPLVNKIYFPVKTIVEFVFFPPEKTFQSVVMLEYPRKGIFSIGFITKESSHKLSEKTGKKLYNVFIPSTPSPLTGFTVVAGEDELNFLDISIEEAMKFIISGGLLNFHD